MENYVFDLLLDYYLGKLDINGVRDKVAEKLIEIFKDPFCENATLVAEFEDIIVQAEEKGAEETFIRDRVGSLLTTRHFSFISPGINNSQIGTSSNYTITSDTISA